MMIVNEFGEECKMSFAVVYFWMLPEKSECQFIRQMQR